MNATPGPWEITSQFVGPYTIKSGDEEIAHVGGEINGVVLANAAVIAAAPELLALLKLIVSDSIYGGGFHNLTATNAKRCLDAIAKAEGSITPSRL